MEITDEQYALLEKDAMERYIRIIMNDPTEAELEAMGYE